jgi:hypothetical protein
LAGRCAGVRWEGAANAFLIHHLTVLNSPRPGSRLPGRCAGVRWEGAANAFLIHHLTVLKFSVY